MDNNGDGDPGASTLPSSPPVIGAPASPSQPFHSSGTERGDDVPGKSHFWDSSAAETPSRGKRRVIDFSGLPQAKRQCVQGVSTDATTPDPTGYRDLAYTHGVADIAFPKQHHTELPQALSALARNDISSATVATSFAQPGNSNLKTKSHSIVPFDPHLDAEDDVFGSYMPPWGTGDSEFDEQMELLQAAQNHDSSDYSAAPTSAQPPVPVGQDNNDAVPERDTSAPADEGELPQLPRPTIDPVESGSDSYGLTSSFEEEMINLADPVPESLPQRPPSSVIREMAPTSEVYDLALQRSPPGQTATLSKAASTEEDLMDHEMDWDEILQSMPTHPKGSSALEDSDHLAASAAVPDIAITPATQTLQTAPNLQTAPALQTTTPLQAAPALQTTTLLKTTPAVQTAPTLLTTPAVEVTRGLQKSHSPRPTQNLQAPPTFQATQATNTGPNQKQFVRPRFPTPVKDKSPIPGLSKSVVVQICFRMGELVNRASSCRKANQDAIFEFYARVKSSSRHPSGHIQRFVFMDLFKDYPPHLAGTLSGWRKGSVVDELSRDFLGIAEPKMCRCICKVKKMARGSDTHLVVQVLSIREGFWEGVDLVKRSAFRGQ